MGGGGKSTAHMHTSGFQCAASYLSYKCWNQKVAFGDIVRRESHECKMGRQVLLSMNHGILQCCDLDLSAAALNHVPPLYV